MSLNVFFFLFIHILYQYYEHSLLIWKWTRQEVYGHLSSLTVLQTSALSLTSRVHNQDYTKEKGKCWSPITTAWNEPQCAHTEEFSLLLYLSKQKGVPNMYRKKNIERRECGGKWGRTHTNTHSPTHLSIFELSSTASCCYPLALSSLQTKSAQHCSREPAQAPPKRWSTWGQHESWTN